MFYQAPQHPIFEFLKTAGPVSFADTRLKGDSWHFDCHAVLILPWSLIPTPLQETSSSTLTVLLPPETKKSVVLNYLTFCYTGRKPNGVSELNELSSFISILWPSSGGFKQPSSGRFKQPSSGQFKQPSSGQFKQPSSGQFKQPSSGGLQPSSGGLKQPSCGGLKQPSCGGLKQPSSGGLQPSSGGLKKIKVLFPDKRRNLVPDNIVCELCQKIIKYKKNLPKHMSDFHQNSFSDKLSCDICNIQYTSNYNLKRHINSRNCLRNLSHQCKKCKTRFVSPAKLKEHVEKNCPKKYFCSICICFFKYKYKYQEHLECQHNGQEGNLH